MGFIYGIQFSMKSAENLFPTSWLSDKSGYPEQVFRLAKKVFRYQARKVIPGARYPVPGPWHLVLAGILKNSLFRLVGEPGCWEIGFRQISLNM